MTASKPKIGIVGLSHLGITWSVGYASLGFNVIGYDSEKAAVENLQRGILSIPEPGLPELYEKSRSFLQFNRDPKVLQDCDVIFFARDVPMDEEGRIDLTGIDGLWDTVIPILPSPVELVSVSQVPVGYTRRLVTRIRSRRPDTAFFLTYRLQTLTIGQAMADFLQPDRIMIGLAHSGEEPSALVRTVVLDPFRCPVVQATYESAELTKAAISLYLASSVTFVNTVADLCEKVGANLQEIVAAMQLDRRFNSRGYWRPGLGFAGGHIERDLTTLARLSAEHDVALPLVQTNIASSMLRYRWLVRVLEEQVYRHSTAPTLCLWGLAYKKGTDSLHNAHCLKVFRDFGARARIRAYDPVAKLPPSIEGVEVCSDKFAALKGADAVVVLTEWEEFAVNDPRPFVEAMRHPVVIDGVQVVGPNVRTAQGITYVAMGIPVHNGN